MSLYDVCMSCVHVFVWVYVYKYVLALYSVTIVAGFCLLKTHSENRRFGDRICTTCFLSVVMLVVHTGSTKEHHFGDLFSSDTLL